MPIRPAALLSRLQPLGRALMLPIAVLPVAALLLRLGQPDLLDIPFIAAAGNAIFANLGLLFAAGVAVGLARGNHGAAALAGVVAYLVATEGAKALLIPPPDMLAADPAIQAAWRAKEIAKLGVPAGILAGLEWAAANTRCRAIVTVAGDTPFFPGNLTERLASAVADRPGMIAMACSRARPHPTFALWPLAHRKRLATFLANEGNRRVLSFIERQGFRQVDFEDEAGACAPFDPFFNINTPADLAAAELILRGFEP